MTAMHNNSDESSLSFARHSHAFQMSLRSSPGGPELELKGPPQRILKLPLWPGQSQHRSLAPEDSACTINILSSDCSQAQLQIRIIHRALKNIRT